MDEVDTELENFEFEVDKSAIYLNIRSAKTMYYFCTWSIQNFSTIKRVFSKGFHFMDNFTYFFNLSQDEEEMRIIIKCIGRFKYFMEVIDIKCWSFNVTISTDSGKVFFQKISSNTKTVSSFSHCQCFMSVKGDDFQKLKHLLKDSFIFTCRIKRSDIDDNTWRNVPYFTVKNLVNSPLLLSNIKKYSSEENVNLSVGEETEVVNKALLCARSSVFAMMFRNDMREVKDNTVIITDIKMPVIKVFVSFLSSGVVPDGDFDFDFYCELYYAANKYDIKDLQQASIRLLLVKVSRENIFRVLKLSLLHNDELLKLTVMAMISANIETIEMTSDWNNLTLYDPEIALKASTFFDF